MSDPIKPVHGDTWMDNSKLMVERRYDSVTGEWVSFHEFEWREHKRAERNTK